jgi:hypothetical protein
MSVFIIANTVTELEMNVFYTGECTTSLIINSSMMYQTVEGFGGAVTDAAGINWKNLVDKQLQYNLIKYDFITL